MNDLEVLTELPAAYRLLNNQGNGLYVFAVLHEFSDESIMTAMPTNFHQERGNRLEVYH